MTDEATLRVDVRTPDGSAAGTVELPAATFGIEPNQAVLHQVVTAQLAAARSGTHNTKTRAEVRGGGAKPWRQKGTGRARHGSSRNPQWRGGGVATGPKPRSYRQRTPKKMVQLALRSALSDRAAERKIAVVDAWEFETPRTKDAKAAIAALGLEGKLLLVADRDDTAMHKSFRNLPEVHVLLVEELNAYDVLCSDWVVFTRATLPGGTAVTGDAAAPTGATTPADVPNTAQPQAGMAGPEVDDAPVTPVSATPDVTAPQDGLDEAGADGAGDSEDGGEEQT